MRMFRLLISASHNRVIKSEIELALEDILLQKSFPQKELPAKVTSLVWG